MTSRAALIFCPFCLTGSLGVPSVASAMGVFWVEGGKPATAQPFAAPHFAYVCPRCGYGEIHEELVGAKKDGAR